MANLAALLFSLFAKNLTGGGDITPPPPTGARVMTELCRKKAADCSRPVLAFGNIFALISKFDLLMTSRFTFFKRKIKVFQLNLRLQGVVVQPPPSGFPRITRERIGGSSQNLVYLTCEQFYTFSENLKTVSTMTFDM